MCRYGSQELYLIEAMPRLTHLVLILPTMLLTGILFGQNVGAEGDSQVARSRLATCLTRYAREVLGTEPLTVQGLAAGINFLVDATALDPDLEVAWRLLLDAAVLTERDDLVDLALPKVVSLSPQSSGTRLQRLWRALDQTHRLSKKSAMIDRLIEPANRTVVGDAVASRLALRLALLHRQAGDEKLFWNYVSRAIQLDPANQDAVLLRTGLDQHLAQSDPVQWAKLLLNLYRINPTDSKTAAEIGMLLLHHGAYDSAARMLGIARDLERQAGRDAGGDFDADYLLALWAADKIDEADDLMLDRQQRLNKIYRQLAMQEEIPRTSTLELASLVAPLSPKLAAAECLMALRSDDPLRLSDALGEAERAINDLDRLRESDGIEPEPRAKNLKRLLWLLLVLDGSPGSIEDVAHRIDALSPLSSTELALIGAATKPEIPIDQVEASLREAAGTSAVASVVLAKRLEQAGRNKTAAEVLFSAWQQHPGSMMGVLAGKRLGDILGVNLPMSETAAAMSALIDSVPRVFDRIAKESSLFVTLRVTPRSTVVEPFEPVIFDFEIANHTAEPLGINPNGPIEDLLLVQPAAAVPYATISDGPPIFLDLGRNVVIEPHGELNLSLDLRTTWVGSVLDARPLHGAVIDAKAFLNPRIATSPTSFSPVPRPGPLGAAVESGEMRVNGVRIDSTWVDAALVRLKKSVSSRDTKTIALLTFVANEQRSAEGAIELTPGQLTQIGATVAEAWPQLSVVSQAWLTILMPKSIPLKSVWSLVEGSTDSLIHRIYLMRIVAEYSDPGQALSEPAVVAGLLSDDQQVRALAEWVEATLLLQAENQFGAEEDAATGP